MRKLLGWLPKEQRKERWMSSFASVYWSEVYRRGVGFQPKTYRY